MINLALAPQVVDVALAGWCPGSTAQRIPVAGESGWDLASPLERLVRISQSNDRLAGELAQARHRVKQALAYASDPHSRRGLGEALVAHARKKQSEILTQLRSNRSEALAILASIAPSAPASR